jgi:hypothetical protein
MDELLAKLTNLSYEIFGILLPGFIGATFLLLTWAAAGNIPALLTAGQVPALDLHVIHDHDLSYFDILYLGISFYFIGHLLHHLARTARPVRKGAWTLRKLFRWIGSGLGRRTTIGLARWANPWRVGGTRRTILSLAFKIPKPTRSYDPRLDPILKAVLPSFGLNPTTATWRQFYPLAKIQLTEKLSHSLVSTYQNKYTLHRSVTAGGILWFWTSLTLLAMGVHLPNSEPYWAGLGAMPFLSIFVVWAFSDGFAYNWQLFGDTLITESYALNRGFVG